MMRERGSQAEEKPIGRRRFVRRAGSLGAVCIAAPVLAACEILAAREDDRYTVEINRNERFEPASLTVPLGATVVWKNMSQDRHAVTTDESALEGAGGIVRPDGVAPWRSSDLLAGQTWTHRFTTPGTYVYVCPFHYETGMIGLVRVEEE